MKKILAIIIISLFCFHTVHAQGGIYISLEGGLALPVGKFGGKSEILEDGYAKAGLDGIASAGIRLTENLGIGVKLAYIHNKLDGPENVFTNITPWKSTAILGALSYAHPLNESLYFEGELDAGYWMTQFPEANFAGNIRVAETGGGFGYGVGVGLKYMLAEDFGFKLSANYLGSNPAFKGALFTFSQKVDIIAFNWGIVFQL